MRPRRRRHSLVEFSFDRFIATFDLLDAEVRRTTGALVRKINPQAVAQLAAELRTRSRTRRLRALAIAGAMSVQPELESVLVELLADEDPLVRSEAARALGQCPTSVARAALAEALADRHNAVKAAAQASLDLLSGREPSAELTPVEQHA